MKSKNPGKKNIGNASNNLVALFNEMIGSLSFNEMIGCCTNIYKFASMHGNDK